MHEILDPLEAGNPLFRFYSRIMGKLIMAGADAFVVHSPSVKEQAVRVYHLPDERVFVVPHGIYDNYYQEFTQENSRQELGIKEEFVVLYFGMIRKYKGVPCLVEAFNQLPRDMAEKSRLIITGEDWGDEKELEGAVRTSPYAGQISFKPEFVPESSVPKYFSAADTVVLPYLRTAGSGVAGLAMAFGKPVIISDLEGLKESLKEYPGALFVPRGDASSIAARLCGIYQQRQAGGSNTFAAPPGLRWQHITEQYAQIINYLKNVD
jgi:glycosyltransferase involved in cell wall biosynthesis